MTVPPATCKPTCASVMPVRQSTGILMIFSGYFSARSSMEVPPWDTGSGDAEHGAHVCGCLGQGTTGECVSPRPQKVLCEDSPRPSPSPLGQKGSQQGGENRPNSKTRGADTLVPAPPSRRQVDHVLSHVW